MKKIIFAILILVQSLCFPAVSSISLLEQYMNECTLHASVDDIIARLLEFCNHVAREGVSKVESDNGIRFFTNTLKRVPGISHGLVHEMLQSIFTSMPSCLSSMMHTSFYNLAYEMYTEQYKNFVKQYLIQGIADHFPEFKKSPELVLDQLSLELAAYCEEERAAESLRRAIVQCVDLAVSKTLWSPKAPLSAWHSCLRLAQDLCNLMIADIITNPADLDDLMWTLTQRFALFIELAGSLMSESDLASIAADLKILECPFRLVVEQNSCMLSKVAYLEDTIAKARSRIQIVGREAASVA